MGSSVNFHTHQSPSHHHHAGRTGTGFSPAWENTEEQRDKVDRGPQDKDMVPTDTISHIAGHGCLQLLREPCSLFAFVSLCRACVCTYTRGLVPPVLMWVCVCVCVCVCVFLAQHRRTDEGVRRATAKRREEEARGVPRLRVFGRRICAVILSRVGKKKGWPVIIQGMAPMCATRPKRKTCSPFLPCYFVCLDHVEDWVVGG